MSEIAHHDDAVEDGSPGRRASKNDDRRWCGLRPTFHPSDASVTGSTERRPRAGDHPTGTGAGSPRPRRQTRREHSTTRRRPRHRQRGCDQRTTSRWCSDPIAVLDADPCPAMHPGTQSTEQHRMPCGDVASEHEDSRRDRQGRPDRTAIRRGVFAERRPHSTETKRPDRVQTQTHTPATVEPSTSRGRKPFGGARRRPRGRRDNDQQSPARLRLHAMDDRHIANLAL